MLEDALLCLGLDSNTTYFIIKDKKFEKIGTTSMIKFLLSLPRITSIMITRFLAEQGQNCLQHNENVTFLAKIFQYNKSIWSTFMRCDGLTNLT